MMPPGCVWSCEPFKLEGAAWTLIDLVADCHLLPQLAQYVDAAKMRALYVLTTQCSSMREWNEVLTPLLAILVFVLSLILSLREQRALDTTTRQEKPFDKTSGERPRTSWVPQQSCMGCWGIWGHVNCSCDPMFDGGLLLVPHAPGAPGGAGEATTEGAWVESAKSILGMFFGSRKIKKLAKKRDTGRCYRQTGASSSYLRCIPPC